MGNFIMGDSESNNSGERSAEEGNRGNDGSLENNSTRNNELETEDIGDDESDDGVGGGNAELSRVLAALRTRDRNRRQGAAPTARVDNTSSVGVPEARLDDGVTGDQLQATLTTPRVNSEVNRHALAIVSHGGREGNTGHQGPRFDLVLGGSPDTQQALAGPRGDPTASAVIPVNASASPTNNNAFGANAGNNGHGVITGDQLRTAIAGALNFDGNGSDTKPAAVIPVIASASPSSTNTVAHVTATGLPPFVSPSSTNPSWANGNTGGVAAVTMQTRQKKGKKGEQWVYIYKWAKAEYKEAVRTFQATRSRNAAGHLQQVYDLDLLGAFLLVPLKMKGQNYNRTMQRIRSMYDGRGLSNKAWDIALLDGQQITTLDYNFTQVVNMTAFASARLGDSSNGWLTHSVRYLQRYQEYYDMMITDETRFNQIENWRKHFGLE